MSHVTTYLDEVSELTEELDPMYPPESEDNSPSDDMPTTEFIASSQQLSMKYLLDAVQNALIYTYTTDEQEQKQIGERLFTTHKLQEKLDKLDEKEQLDRSDQMYEHLSGFYRGELRPFVTETVTFIDSIHTPITPEEVTDSNTDNQTV